MNIIDWIQRSELRRLRYGFYKLIYIRPTAFCPASCRHCSARSGPSVQRTSNVEMLKKWVSSVISLPGVEWVGMEGGEPFAVPTQLELILRMAHQAGIATSVLTNAFWAIDMQRAREVLEKLPKIDFLIISADEFHEEYIPLSRVVVALRAAREYVIRLGVQICVGPGYPAFRERFERLAGNDLLASIDIIETPLQYIGRAKESGIMGDPEYVNELPEGACLFLGTPVLREDGIFVACCQQEAVLEKRPNLFQLGNLDKHNAQEFKDLVDTDVYFQTLRVFGPKMIAETAIQYHWGWEPRPYLKGYDCDLCMHLASHPKVVEGFRHALDTPEHRKKLALGRSVIYNEPLSNV